MADANWEKVKEIFSDAKQCGRDEREAFLDAACGDDENLRREVESLLSSFDEASGFLGESAVGEVASMVLAEKHQLEKGERLAHYEIVRQIGAGGMGEVYLAADKKLDRKVALKILNEKFSKHESNLQRFIREAKAASALNHPNILVIHESAKRMKRITSSANTSKAKLCAKSSRKRL